MRCCHIFMCSLCCLVFQYTDRNAQSWALSLYLFFKLYLNTEKKGLFVILRPRRLYHGQCWLGETLSQHTCCPSNLDVFVLPRPCSHVKSLSRLYPAPQSAGKPIDSRRSLGVLLEEHCKHQGILYLLSHD